MKNAQNYIGYVYLTTNLVNGKQYVGQHLATEFDTKYKGSGNAIRSAFKKYGWDNFKCEVICWCSTQDELNYREQCEIAFHCCFSPNGYNLKYGGHRGKMRKDSKGKLSSTLKVVLNTPETHKKLVKSHIGNVGGMKDKHHTEKSRNQMSKAQKKRFENDEEHKKVSDCVKDLWKNEDYRKKQSNSRKGRIVWNKGLKDVEVGCCHVKFVCPLLLCYKYYAENKSIGRCCKELDICRETFDNKLEKYNLSRKCK